MKTPEQKQEQLYKICENLNYILFDKYYNFPKSVWENGDEKRVEILENRLEKLFKYYCNLREFVPKKQAIKALKEGKKVTHVTFSNNCFIFYKDSKYYFFDGVKVKKTLFTIFFRESKYNEYWLIIPDHEQ